MESTIHWMDFIPLALFIWGGRLANFISSTHNSTSHAFFLGASAALIQLVYWVYHKQSIDYLALGANLFLIVGALGVVFDSALLEATGFFKQATLFAWILLVGGIATFSTPRGFLHLPKNNLFSFVGSLTLLALTGIALVLSYGMISYFKFGIGLGIGIPFVSLVSFQEILKNYFLKHG